MAIENVISLENITAYMMFTVVLENGQTEEQSLEVNCAEEIEGFMKLFISEKWDELFNDSYDPEEFSYAYFNGFSFINNDKNRVSMQIYGTYKQGSCMLDLNALADKNAEKLKKIREISNE
ncbi:hypothetical protein ABD87_22615 [Lysinibacillus sphaericus]|uniref:hypothetical protein n=1 Tax=Lysinibacillus sphaericus TaxID=1421 RepID=UPI0018CF3220|nr:hypothetical protein [Lysinibacillus sphaericus]MBG9732220.1 hypothetical protein [Lysinibacillus sphaericus]